jgi:hypothetical protein
MIAAATAAPTSNCAIALQRGSAGLSDKVRSVRYGWMAGAIAGLKEFGPYAAIELVLPGGSLIAILLWLHRRRQLKRTSNSLCSCSTSAIVEVPAKRAGK